MTHVRRAVVLGQLQPGDKLREVKLAAELQVSRPTLREAPSLLVQDGLLVQEPYRGLVDAIDSRDLARIEEQLRRHTVESAEELLTLDQP